MNIKSMLRSVKNKTKYHFEKNTKYQHKNKHLDNTLKKNNKILLHRKKIIHLQKKTTRHENIKNYFKNYQMIILHKYSRNYWKKNTRVLQKQLRKSDISNLDNIRNHNISFLIASILKIINITLHGYFLQLLL